MSTELPSSLPNNDVIIPPTLPTGPSIAPLLPPRRSAMHWLRLLLEGNPLYLLSAALLLFGINRLVVDPSFLGSANPKLVFTFSSLQLYEVLLAGVAILLARRRIWYDATLLLVLENALVLVPFILIAEAVVTERWLAYSFCIGGAVLAGARFASLRCGIREWNLPASWMVGGALVLAANLALPFIFRPLIEQDVANWQTPSHYAWLLVLPLLQSIANLPALVRPTGPLPMQRTWLPWFMFTLWIAASGVHLWCVGYVCNLHLKPFLLAPVLWAAAWTLYRRLRDLVPHPAPWLRGTLLGLPVLLTFLATGVDKVFLPLTALNAVLCGVMMMLHRDRLSASLLMQFSLVTLVGALPETWTHPFLPKFSRAEWILGAGWTWVVLRAVMSKRPLAGLCGAVLASLQPALWFGEERISLALQIGTVFLLLHSLRWPTNETPWPRGARWFAAGLWIVNSLMWTHRLEWEAFVNVSGAGLLVLLCSVLVRWLTGQWVSRAVPMAAVLSLLATPLNALVGALRTAHPGVLAVLGSFVLFGLGTALALTRHRWPRRTVASVAWSSHPDPGPSDGLGKNV